MQYPVRPSVRPSFPPSLPPSLSPSPPSPTSLVPLRRLALPPPSLGCTATLACASVHKHPHTRARLCGHLCMCLRVDSRLRARVDTCLCICACVRILCARLIMYIVCITIRLSMLHSILSYYHTLAGCMGVRAIVHLHRQAFARERASAFVRCYFSCCRCRRCCCCCCHRCCCFACVCKCLCVPYVCSRVRCVCAHLALQPPRDRR